MVQSVQKRKAGHFKGAKLSKLHDVKVQMNMSYQNINSVNLLKGNPKPASTSDYNQNMLISQNVVSQETRGFSKTIKGV